MKRNLIQEAIAEAERFIKCAKSVPLSEDYGSCKHRAAAKRASMDLTRKLAELRTTDANEWFRK